MKGSYKVVYLHRVIAEQIIGRKLKPGEVVHHLDEDKSNNSPDNLIVCSSASVHGRYHKRRRSQPQASLRQKLEPDRPLVKDGDLWF